MTSVADPAVEVVLSAIERALDAAGSVGVVPVDGRDASGVVRRLEGIARRVYGLQVELVGELEQRGLFGEDGHRTARSMVGFAANLSGADAARRARAARMARDMPAVAAALGAGRLGVSQADRIARVHANPRVADQLVAVDADLAVVAERLRYDEFDGYLTRWEYLADEDGAKQRAERDHRRRDVSIRQSPDGSYRIVGGCGSLQGTITADILDAYAQAEREADWAEARGRLGDAATVADLVRTDAQRRMDALERIFTEAAGSLAERTGHQTITDIVIDQQTLERATRRLVGDDPGPDPRTATWWADLAAFLTADPDPDRTDGDGDSDGDGRTQPGHPAHRVRSDTIDGRWIDPTEAAALTLISRMRRVVMGSDGVVIDVGRTQRLFTGAARLAVMLSLPSCYWLGCTVRAQHCQADHLLPWDAGGSTSPGNGTSSQPIPWGRVLAYPAIGDRRLAITPPAGYPAVRMCCTVRRWTRTRRPRLGATGYSS